MRLIGIGLDGSCAAAPSGSTARYFAPSSVLIMMDAVLASPIQVCLTRKVTFTWPRASETPVTLPTSTPATRTSLPGTSPADSVKSAV